MRLKLQHLTHLPNSLCIVILIASNSLALTYCCDSLCTTECSLVTNTAKYQESLKSSSTSYESKNRQPNIISYLHELTCDSSEFFTSYFFSPKRTVQNRIIKSTKYLLYDVNAAEGFNLRRDVYIRMAKLAKLLNSKSADTSWILVLPPWTDLFHWTNRHVPNKKLSWSEFFDVESLGYYVPVIELDEFIDMSRWTIDLVYYLSNYESLDVNNWIEKLDVKETNKIGPYFKQTKNGSYKGYFWSYSKFKGNDVKDVKFQGTVSFMADKILNDSRFANIKSFMIDRAETMLHDSFGDVDYWKCRRSMRFSAKLIHKAEELRDVLLNSNNKSDRTRMDKDWRKNKRLHSTAIGGPYLAVHLRRGDFLYSRKSTIVNIHNAAKQIKNELNRLNLTTIYLATDSSIEEINDLKASLPDFQLFFYKPNDLNELYEFKDGGIAIIDQLVCAHARYFIGTYESTFSFRIQEEREILGFDPRTTFNILCLEKKPFSCESTKWLIRY